MLCEFTPALMYLVIPKICGIESCTVRDARQRDENTSKIQFFCLGAGLKIKSAVMEDFSPRPERQCPQVKVEPRITC